MPHNLYQGNYQKWTEECVHSHLFPWYENRYSWHCEFRDCYCNWDWGWWLAASSCSVRKFKAPKQQEANFSYPLPVAGTESPKLYRTHDPLISARAFRCKFLLPSRLWSFHFIFIALRVVFGSQQGHLVLSPSPHSVRYPPGWRFAQHALST